MWLAGLVSSTYFILLVTTDGYLPPVSLSK